MANKSNQLERIESIISDIEVALEEVKAYADEMDDIINANNEVNAELQDRVEELEAEKKQSEDNLRKQ